MVFSQKDLKYICSVFSLSCELPVFLLDREGNIIYESASTFVKNPMLQSKEELLLQLWNADESSEFPHLQTTSYLENFICISLQDARGYQGAVLAGPVIDSRLTEEMLEAFIQELDISAGRREEISAYYQECKYISKMKLVYLSMQLYYMLYQKRVDSSEVIMKNKTVDTKLLEIENPHVNISERRQEVRLHHDLEYEKKVLQCITEGNKEEVIEHWRNSGNWGEPGVLSKKSHLRNSKNLGITVITLATRAAMDGGLHHEIAYTLSDMYIQNLEELQSSRDVDHFIEYVLGDFAERVEKNRELNYSKPINRCLNYIFSHLYEDISLNKLARVADVHPNYLSSLFKKEVGTNVKTYISAAKVEEAKTLIRFTDYSLLKISTLLDFHDQSYFTKTFKKFTGVTPNYYKKHELQ